MEGRVVETLENAQLVENWKLEDLLDVFQRNYL